MKPADLRISLAKADVSGEVLQTLSSRLEDSNADAASVARAISLPWTRGYARPPAIAAVQSALESEHFAPPQAVTAIVEHVTAHHAQESALQPSHAPLRLLCLSGPDGVGTTVAARSIARALGKPIEVVDLEQLGAAEEIWRREGQPGALMGAVEQAQSAEAVVVLAGLDRAANVGVPMSARLWRGSRTPDGAPAYWIHSSAFRSTSRACSSSSPAAGPRRSPPTTCGGSMSRNSPDFSALRKSSSRGELYSRKRWPTMAWRPAPCCLTGTPFWY